MAGNFAFVNTNDFLACSIKDFLSAADGWISHGFISKTLKLSDSPFLLCSEQLKLRGQGMVIVSLLLSSTNWEAVLTNPALWALLGALCCCNCSLHLDLPWWIFIPLLFFNTPSSQHLHCPVLPHPILWFLYHCRGLWMCDLSSMGDYPSPPSSICLGVLSLFGEQNTTQQYRLTVKATENTLL